MAKKHEKKEQFAEHKEKKGMSLNKKIIAAILFLFSYALIAVISMSKDSINSAVQNIPILNLLFPLPNLFAKEFWYSPTYILYPVVGFFLIFLLIDWLNNYFKIEIGFSPIFPILFFVFSIIAMFLALYFYFEEIKRLSGQAAAFDLFGELKDSAFYLFVWAGLFGWLARCILEKIDI